MELTFYDYWRSSSAYRVRIALNLKGVEYRSVTVNLLDGEQRKSAYRSVNAQGLVPALAIGDEVITQSLAIIDWLDRRFPDPVLIPADPFARAQALGRAQVIAADIQPLQNLRVLGHLRDEMAAGEGQVTAWIHRWIGEGFAALEEAAPDAGLFGGDCPDIADVFLVPQITNALRYKLPMAPYPKLTRIDAALRKIDAFAKAAPEAVKST